MSVQPSIGAMNALNWNNSTGVSLLAASNRQFKVNDFGGLAGQLGRSLVAATRPSPKPQIADRPISATGILRPAPGFRPAFVQTDKQNGKHCGRQCAENASSCPHASVRPPIGRAENGWPVKPRADRIEKPKKKLKKSKKLVEQQLNQIQQQASHVVQGGQRPTVLVSLANEISRTAGKQAKPPASRQATSGTNNEAKSDPIEVVNEHSRQPKFSWSSYLKETNSVAAPLKCFKPNQTFNNKPNYFKPGMKLEAIDPRHPSLFCVASVVEVVGFRMRIHLDKYSSQFDFWVNCDSPFIFYVGFTSATGRRLQPPKNYRHFDWSSYLHQEKTKAAPKHCFYWYNKSTETLTGFRKGMKLEAVDRANAALVRVATISDVLGGWLLIHLDGCSDDYWTEHDSPHLHPINWSKKQKLVQLTPPKDLAGRPFEWEDYLKKSQSSVVISNQFRPRSQNTFKVKMKVEAVDPLNPRYVRVATVTARTAFAVKIHFDNFDRRFDFWLSDNSPDLHPVQWCLQANINLEPPPTAEFRSSSACPNCNGIGHLRNPNALKHSTTADCPYAVENANYQPPDRLTADTHSLTNSHLHSRSTADSDSRSSVSSPADNGHLPPNVERNAERNVERNAERNTEQELVKELNSFVNTLSPEEVLGWSCEKVSDLVSILPKCLDLAQLFLDEHLDGQSFLLLTHGDLVNILGIKQYQAFLIYTTICQIRHNLIK